MAHSISFDGYKVRLLNNNVEVKSWDAVSGRNGTYQPSQQPCNYSIHRLAHDVQTPSTPRKAIGNELR